MNRFYISGKLVLNHILCSKTMKSTFINPFVSNAPFGANGLSCINIFRTKAQTPALK